jgi:uncharacterized protein (DUF885 family)
MLTSFPQFVVRPMLAAMLAAGVVPAMAQAPAAKPASAAPASAAEQAADAAFASWSDDFAAQWIRMSPERATASQYFSGAEQAALDRQLTPGSKERRAQIVALAKTGQAKVDQFLAGPLSPTTRISAETMRWSLARTIAGEPYTDYSFVFSQFSGPQISLVNFMADTHPMRNAQDVSSFMARLEQIASRMDEATARAREAAAKSLIPPRFILEKAQGQVDAFLAPAPDKNAFVVSLTTRSAKIADLKPEVRAEAIAAATKIVAEKIRPAFERTKAFLAEIHPRTTSEAGISRLPGGAAAYADALANFTGTNLTADQIHQIGLREVARIEAEMDKHLRTLGFANGTINERVKLLDAKHQPPAGADPRPAILKQYADMVRDAEKRSEKLFNVKPRAPVEVRREPAISEGSAAAHYTTPAPDGSRPGVFWVPMRGPEFDIIRMRSLSYHEAVPGHHFQLAIQQELTGLPKFRTQRLFGGGSSHSEGWALYTERLAVEEGWYEGDIPGLIGALGSELFRARRLVVDTGIHSKGWTRQQAIDYGIGAQEVERYVVWPGQATAYMVGMLRILELREKAKATLGAKFSLPAFHDVVLKTGSVPLDVLARVLDDWAAAQK